MRVQKKNKAFAYRGTIGDYNYLQCRIHGLVVIEGMNLSGHPWIINEIGF